MNWTAKHAKSRTGTEVLPPPVSVRVIGVVGGSDYAGLRVIQERDGNNTPLVSYTRGTDLSGTLEGAGGIGGLLGRSAGNGTTWTTNVYYHADGNGNVTYLVSGAQTVAALYRYDPYGNLIGSSENSVLLGGSANTYRFSSKMADLKTGLYYYGYRWYSANLQRWVNRDPINEFGFVLLTQGQNVFSLGEEKNLYAFVFNTPVTIVDIYGLAGFWRSKWFPWNWPIWPPYYYDDSPPPPKLPPPFVPPKENKPFSLNPFRPSITCKSDNFSATLTGSYMDPSKIDLDVSVGDRLDISVGYHPNADNQDDHKVVLKVGGKF